MLLVLLLLLGIVAVPDVQGIDIASITSAGGDRTSLIFAPSSGQPASSPNPPETTATTTPTPGTNDTDISSVRPIKQIHPTRATPRATNGSIALHPLSNQTGGPMIIPFPRPNGTKLTIDGTTLVPPSFLLPSLNTTHQKANWTHEVLNQTSDGTLLIATYPPLNWSLPFSNGTHNGTIVFPTFPGFNWALPLANRTSNGSVTIPPFPRLNISLPWGAGILNSSAIFPSLPPLILSRDGPNGTMVFPALPSNWTFPGANVSQNGTILFPPANWTLPTFPAMNWTQPGLNWTLPPLNFSLPTTTVRPTNSTGSTTTPRPGTSPRPTPILWTWKPANGTSETTNRPGTGSTQRWTPPTWSNLNRSTTANPVSGFTRFPTGSSFGTTSRPGTTSFPSFTGRFTFGPTPPYPSSPRYPSSPIFYPTTTSRSPLSTDVPNSLSQLLQTWRSRFVADMEAVRQNITQFLLH